MKYAMSLTMYWRNNMLIHSVYGMTVPKPTKEHLKKLQAAIDYLGDKYRLAKPVERVKNDKH